MYSCQMRKVIFRPGLFGRSFLLLALLLMVSLLVWMHVLENTLNETNATALSELAMLHDQTNTTTVSTTSQISARSLTDKTRWASWVAGALLLALFGAAMVAAYLNRPLSELAHAARRISKGSFDVLLPECGPQELCDLSAEFNQMSRQLQVAESDRTLLLAAVAHDLRGPLARIRLEIELSAMPPTQVELIEQDLRFMDQTLENLLSYARPCDSPPATPIDLRNTVIAMVQRYGSWFEADRVNLSYRAPEPVFCRIETEDIERCLLNLLDNTRLHGRSFDGQAITHVALLARGDRVWIEVKDEGVGLNGQDPADWVQPFRRGKGVSRSVPGTGLGLASVNRIAAYWGGELQLLDRPRGGLTARIVLPRTFSA